MVLVQSEVAYGWGRNSTLAAKTNLRAPCDEREKEPTLTDAARCPNYSNVQEAGFAKRGGRHIPAVHLQS